MQEDTLESEEYESDEEVLWSQKSIKLVNGIKVKKFILLVERHLWFMARVKDINTLDLHTFEDILDVLRNLIGIIVDVAEMPIHQSI
jgi:hypothetical protein